MDAAAEAIDRAGYVESGVSIFTTMHVSTSYGLCFGWAPTADDISIHDSHACAYNVSPDFLLCFEGAASYVSVDCRTDEGVVLIGQNWTPTSG